MTKQFVRVLANVNCEWEGLNPVYRVYVNDELFAEHSSGRKQELAHWLANMKSGRAKHSK